MGAFEDCTNLTSINIPNSLTSIGSGVFDICASLTTITIPNSVTNLGNYAFSECSSLTNVYFKGNAPSLGAFVFSGDNDLTVYYLPRTTGWAQWVAPPRAVLWNPLVQTSGVGFGVQTNQFGFTITGIANIPLVVEACTNLAGSVWTALQTVALTNGLIYFSDPQWTSYPARCYRLRSP